MIDVVRLNGALGAELGGVDLTKSPDPAEVDELRRLLVEHQVLFFRDQALTPEQHQNFAASFGPLLLHPTFAFVPGFPAVNVLDNGKDNPSKIDKWHSDMTFTEKPPMGAVLIARVVPKGGTGATEWLSASAAYDALSEPLRRFLAPLRAEHSLETGYKESLAEPGGRERLRQPLADHPPVIHPVVRTHPVSGRRCIFVNEMFTSRILDLSEDESTAVLAFLYRHLCKPEFRIRFEWQVNSVAFWDNCSTQHLPVNDYWPQRRRVERVVIGGPRPK